MKPDWKGVYPALTTKFTEALTLDIPLFLKNLQAQVEAGVDGVIIGGSLGEASTLKHEEKLELLRAAKEAFGTRIPILVNVAERATADAVRVVQDAQEHGADGLMVLPPMQYKATDAEVVAWFRSIAEATDLPIMVYNNPVDYKIEVTVPMFEQLLKLDNIQAVKESTRDVSNVTRLRNAFGERLRILCGVDTLALEELLLGADGWVAGLVCAFPRETVAIYRLAQAGRIQEALEIYRWFMPILELDISPQLVQNIKLAETLVGLGSEHVRPPRLPLQGEERRRVEAILQEGLARRPELPAYLELTTS
ncbi:MAG: dihydrodipicolinate synthase family protein [Bacteroidetes bacterium]|nr:MAG: dihydrodipicolinate synthase family protein [Bacteroidota bacterium]